LEKQQDLPVKPFGYSYFEAVEKGSKVMSNQGVFETHYCLCVLEDKLKDSDTGHDGTVDGSFLPCKTQ
jgi:hypothetical protein